MDRGPAPSLDQESPSALRKLLGLDNNSTIAEVARELGVGAETFRKWVRQDEADRGEAPEKPTSAQLAELARLKRENVELRRTNEILRLASSFFAQEADPTPGGREICPGPPRGTRGGAVVSGAGDAGVDAL